MRVGGSIALFQYRQFLWTYLHLCFISPWYWTLALGKSRFSRCNRLQIRPKRLHCLITGFHENFKLACTFSSTKTVDVLIRSYYRFLRSVLPLETYIKNGIATAEISKVASTIQPRNVLNKVKPSQEQTYKLDLCEEIGNCAASQSREGRSGIDQSRKCDKWWELYRSHWYSGVVLCIVEREV
jgi:hypothetical protein